MINRIEAVAEKTVREAVEEAVLKQLAEVAKKLPPSKKRKK